MKNISIKGKVIIKGISFFLLALKTFFFYWMKTAQIGTSYPMTLTMKPPTKINYQQKQNS